MGVKPDEPISIVSIGRAIGTAQRRRIGRDDRIGTREIFDPKQRRYQAALHPFQLVYSVIIENPCPPRSEHCPTSLIGFLSVHHGVVGIKSELCTQEEASQPRFGPPSLSICIHDDIGSTYVSLWLSRQNRRVKQNSDDFPLKKTMRKKEGYPVDLRKGVASLRSPPFRSPQLLNPILNVQLGIHKFTSLSSSNKIVMLVVTSILIAPSK
ncbi:hypothetical protein Tco_0485507 [Tanacetum coccineum]